MANSKYHCQWIYFCKGYKHFNEKSEVNRLDKTPNHSYMLSIRKSFEKHRHIKYQKILKEIPTPLPHPCFGGVCPDLSTKILFPVFPLVHCSLPTNDAGGHLQQFLSSSDCNREFTLFVQSSSQDNMIFLLTIFLLLMSLLKAILSFQIL